MLTIYNNYDRKIYNDYVQQRIDITPSIVDSGSIQDYEQSQSLSIAHKETKSSRENPELHKARIVSVITETVLVLLKDLPPSMKENLLEDETPEELVIYCKEKYDKEFDLNVDSLGIAGAHEIAWQEALAILQNEQP